MNTQLEPRTIEDANGGFSVAVDASNDVLRVVAWGFWSVEVAVSFAPTLREICLQSPRSKSVVLDVRDLKPMREEGQRGYGEFVGALDALRVERVTVVAAGPLTKLQLLRIAREQAQKELIAFAES